MAKRAKRLPKGWAKLQPKLRMYENGGPKVNALRAVRSSVVAVEGRGPAPSALERPLTKSQFESALRSKGKSFSWEKGKAKDAEVNVFVTTRERRLEKLPGLRAESGNLAMARVSLTQLKELTARGEVLRVEAGETLKRPRVIRSNTSSRIDLNKASAKSVAKLRRIDTSGLKYTKGRVLVGIIDVEGFDFAHEDFLNAAKNDTRFLCIWDQGGDKRFSPTKSNPVFKGFSQFDYGCEIGHAEMTDAIRNAKSARAPAVRIARQSEMVPGSHGTHVASIAAGNSGVCPHAKIAAVLVSLPSEDWDDRRKSFYDSTRIADAVDYLVAVAEAEGLPLSINISLGTNGHAHDGSAPVCRWIDSLLSTPGRAVSIAAGNAGQEDGEYEDDFGWVMGRIHTEGRIPSQGLENDIEWEVVGNTMLDISENELEVWYSPQDRFQVKVRPPGSEKWYGPFRAGEYLENEPLPDGSMLSVYSETYHPANGCNTISVYLSPRFTDDGVIGIPSGTWVVRLIGERVRDGSYHGWIERDDPQEERPIGDREAWSFPSFFSQRSNVDRCSVSSLACCNWVLSVANYDEAREVMNVSSSQGPDRMGRQKPNVCGPGTDIVAANGFSEKPWISMTGTSMASPYVCGVAALMLSARRDLTAAQILGIVQSTSQPLPSQGYEWANDAGFGRINPRECLREALTVGAMSDMTSTDRT